MELKNKIMSSAVDVVKHHTGQDKQLRPILHVFLPDTLNLELKIMRGRVRGKASKAEGAQFGKNRDWQESNRGE